MVGRVVDIETIVYLRADDSSITNNIRVKLGDAVSLRKHWQVGDNVKVRVGVCVFVV